MDYSSAPQKISNRYIVRPINNDDLTPEYFRLLEEIKTITAVYPGKERAIAQLEIMKRKGAKFVYVVLDSEQNNRLVATGSIVVEEKFEFNLAAYAHIEELAVFSDYQGKGVGRLLVQFMLGLIEKQGILKTVLFTTTDKIGFYNKVGFPHQRVLMLRENFPAEKL